MAEKMLFFDVYGMEDDAIFNKKGVSFNNFILPYVEEGWELTDVVYVDHDTPGFAIFFSKPNRIVFNMSSGEPETTKLDFVILLLVVIAALIGVLLLAKYGG